MKSALKISIKKMPMEKAMKDMDLADESPAEDMAEGGEKKEYDEYMCKDAVETLQKAEEIKSDAGLMKAIQPMLHKKVKAIKSLDDLRTLAKEKGISDRVDG